MRMWAHGDVAAQFAHAHFHGSQSRTRLCLASFYFCSPPRAREHPSVSCLLYFNGPIRESLLAFSACFQPRQAHASLFSLPSVLISSNRPHSLPRFFFELPGSMNRRSENRNEGMNLFFFFVKARWGRLNYVKC